MQRSLNFMALVSADNRLEAFALGCDGQPICVGDASYTCCRADFSFTWQHAEHCGALMLDKLLIEMLMGDETSGFVGLACHGMPCIQLKRQALCLVKS